MTDLIAKSPIVSVIVPCRNEVLRIRECIDSLRQQDLTDIEILVVDGKSEDGTQAVVMNLQQEEPRLRLIDNPRLNAPAAMNIGISCASGEYIQIVGAHSRLSADYCRRAINVLAVRRDIDCVGGRIVTRGHSLVGEAIALAMSSPFGVGNARFRFSGRRAFVDTVAFGTYRSQVFRRIGLFDETLPYNEDDEFNTRLRSAGGRILLDPQMTAQYFSRDTLRGLMQQYFRYGRGKVLISMMYPRLLQARHLVPAMFVLSLLLCVTLVFTYGVMYPLLVLLTLYGLGAAVAALLSPVPAPLSSRVLSPLAFAAMHLSYGFGFLAGIWDQLSWYDENLPRQVR